ncbi:DUF3460 family protein [soil metagenome]
MAAYTSEITQFIASLKQAKPDLESRQLQGRALLWDRPVDADTQTAWNAANVPQKPYVYAPE